jgi:HD-GYP domain-containing protein (c-di-GMP phosphodiesterase class II)
VKDAAGRILYFEGTVEDITESKKAEEKLRKSLVGTIQVISLMLETRDPYTAGHQKRVSSLARSIAQEMNLPNDTIGNIRMAGTIHDIGKLSVPVEILSKPTKLTDIEYSLIKVHPQTGYDILKDVELPSPIAKIVLQHHERLDGSGYPQGLKGEEIILEARIIAVADVVEAIASNRPYRPARGIDAALDEIRKNRGMLYDSAATDACIRIFEEKGFSFE